MFARLPRRPPLALLALAAALAIGLPGAAGAQSLKELYEAARAYDATYLAAKSLAQSAEYRAEQANALRRPSLALSGNARRDEIDFPSSSGTFNSNTWRGDLTGRLPLFNRASDATISQAERSYEVALADLETAEQDLIVRVTQAYFDVLAAQDTLTTTRAAKAAFTEQLASAKRNFEVGTATITDAREAQASFDRATAVEIAAENDLLAKRIALDQLVGRAGVAPKPLRSPIDLPNVAPRGVEDWVTTADGVHPTIRKARLGVEVAKLETDKAKAGKLPTVDAVANVSALDQRGTAIVLSQKGTTTNLNVGVQLNWPLYTGGSVENRIKETLLLEEKAANDLQAARRSVAQVTRVAYFGVQSGVAQVKALEAAEASSKLALEATQLGYRVGVRVNVDVLNAQTQLYTTQRDLSRARYDVILGGLRLRQASGQLTPADIDLADSLLEK
jgi:outer membrane protein